MIIASNWLSVGGGEDQIIDSTSISRFLSSSITSESESVRCGNCELVINPTRFISVLYQL